MLAVVWLFWDVVYYSICCVDGWLGITVPHSRPTLPLCDTYYVLVRRACCYCYILVITFRAVRYPILPWWRCRAAFTFKRWTCWPFSSFELRCCLTLPHVLHIPHLPTFARYALHVVGVTGDGHTHRHVYAFTLRWRCSVWCCLTLLLHYVTIHAVDSRYRSYFTFLHVTGHVVTDYEEKRRKRRREEKKIFALYWRFPLWRGC